MFSLLFSLACAPMENRLERLLEHERADAAVKRGERWLERHPEDDRVRLLVARARLDLVAAVDTVRSWQDFQTAHPEALYEELRAEARRGEAHAWFRDEAAQRGTLSAYRVYLERYPDGDDGPTARQEEARLSLVEAQSAGTAAALRGWREAHTGVVEAATLIRQARPLEVQAAFSEAESAQTVAAWREFRAGYAGWEEAEEALQRAYRQEAELALAQIRTIEEAESFVADYPEPEWRDRADHTTARIRLAPVAAAVAAGEMPDDGELDRWVASLEGHRYISEEAAALEEPLWAEAEAHRRARIWRLWRAIFPDHPRREEALTLETDAAWEETGEALSPEALYTFLSRYSHDPRAREAEEAYWRLNAVEAGRSRWPRAKAIRHRLLADGTTELTVEVKDCHGLRVNGLSADAFQVVQGLRSPPITGFVAMEQDRPLDIVFAIDLSGSMSVERQAVIAALSLFTETLRFRGRTARLGLLAFSERVEVRHGLSADPAQFSAWLRALPQNAGGAGEDSTGSLLEGATMLERSGAERIGILLTDEPLQLNQNGRASLGMSVNRQCTMLQKMAACSVGCRDISCMDRCHSRAGAPYSAALSACERRNSHSSCVRSITSSLRRDVNACGQEISDESALGDQVAARLNEADVHPYLVLPTERGRQLQGFAGLARKTQAQILNVPQDSRSTEPYLRALLDIADQLSRQYVLRFRGEADGADLPTDLLLHLPWRWLPGQPSEPMVALLTEVPPDGTADKTPGAACLPTIGITRAGRISRSTDCGLSWEEIGTGPAPRLTAPGTASLLYLSDGASIWRQEPSGGQIPVQTLLTRIDAIGVGAEILYQYGQDAAGKRLLIRGVEPIPAPDSTAQTDQPTGALEPPLLLPGAQPCLQDRVDRRRCLRGEAWVDLPSDGLPVTLAVAPGGVRALERPGLFLLPLTSGAVYRSIDGGGHWKEVLPPTDGPRDLSALPGKPPRICATSSRSVTCSEEEGMSWYPVGEPFDVAGAGWIGAVGRQILLWQNGQARPLAELLNRDLPSSAVYFKTDEDNFDSSMSPFLREISWRMRQDPTLYLQIEGHADAAGSDNHNEDLARRRALRVAAAVQADGVDAARIVALSYGERRPIRAGASAADMARNRRVELLLLRPASRSAWFGEDCQGSGATPPLPVTPEEDSGGCTN